MEYCKRLRISSFESAILTQSALYLTCECALIGTSCSDIRVFCKNNEYSCSFFFPENEYVLRAPVRSTYVDATIFVSYSLSSQLIETNIRIRKKKIRNEYYPSTLHYTAKRRSVSMLLLEFQLSTESLLLIHCYYCLILHFTQ